MNPATGDRVKLDSRVFPALAHVVFVVEEEPVTPDSERRRIEMVRVEAINTRAVETGGPYLIFVHVEGKPSKWRTVWTSHMVPAVEIEEPLDMQQFSTPMLERFAEIAARMGEVDTHAKIIAEIERRSSR
jgi:hypothetical protein